METDPEVLKNSIESAVCEQRSVFFSKRRKNNLAAELTTPMPIRILPIEHTEPCQRKMGCRVWDLEKSKSKLERTDEQGCLKSISGHRIDQSYINTFARR